jgi:hypothetical protein
MSEMALGSMAFADLTLSLVLHTDKAPSDAEWSLVLDSYRTYAREHSGDYSGMRVLVVIDGGGPYAKQRGDLVTAKKNASVKTAILSDNKVIRGIATAFNWITGDTSMRLFAPTDLSTALHFLDLPADVIPKVLQQLDELQSQLSHPVRCLALAANGRYPAGHPSLTASDRISSGDRE